MNKQRWIWLIAVLVSLSIGIFIFNTGESPFQLASLPYHLLIIAGLFGVWAAFEWRRGHKKLSYLFIALAVYAFTTFCFTTIVF
ncbi:hypothetical protein CR205_10660 [Alteribacter lacisalsi]|jgi:hypothetical protein|uniref:DUF3953 domain-containing protein n=1 Tax=Alteribacter lacisalsi TaxID=2045244 RepID=A0A2W0HCT2_9BACI|nr:hypothetical protein [Alteribacter lacisalsi]PYZ98997.1 hypothetical protein CR205_10660 [Alteribacter lacisalsi]